MSHNAKSPRRTEWIKGEDESVVAVDEPVAWWGPGRMRCQVAGMRNCRCDESVGRLLVELASIGDLGAGVARVGRAEAMCEEEERNEEAVEPVLAASTSGRVECAFWDARRKRRRRAWSSPTGVLYVVDRPNEFLYCELEQGRKLEENVSIDMKHSVSTCFEQGRLGEGKSILMSTSHKLDDNNTLTTHYVNNLRGGEEFTCNSFHSVLPASRLSTCFHVASIGDPTIEVELEQENETKKVSKTFLANLRTGERLLRLQSKNSTNGSLALSNTYITNLRGQHSVRLEAALPLWGFANISKSFTTDFQQNHEFCFKAQQRISERNTLRTAIIRNLHHNNQVSVELKHVAQGRRDVAVKLISNLQGSTQLKVTTSHTRQANCWGWTFRLDIHLSGSTNCGVWQSRYKWWSHQCQCMNGAGRFQVKLTRWEWNGSEKLLRTSFFWCAHLLRTAVALCTPSCAGHSDLLTV